MTQSHKNLGKLQNKFDRSIKEETTQKRRGAMGVDQMHQRTEKSLLGDGVWSSSHTTSYV